MRPYRDWHVLPHGDIEPLAPNLWTVVGRLRMPFGETTRRMTIVRLARGSLVIYSAIALDSRRMRQLEELGRPAFLIVPSGIHRLDVRPWRKRYPQLLVIAPEGARAKVAEVVPVDSTSADFNDPSVQLDVVPGTNRQELAMIVDTGTGKTLVVNDLIFNLPEVPGIAGFGLRVLGFGPGHPSMPALVRRKLVKNDDAVREQLRSWAKLDLERLVVAHGAPIEHPRETLLDLARP